MACTSMILSKSSLIIRTQGLPAISVACYSTGPDPRPIKSLSLLKKGTGGRSSFNGVVATVFGASGYMGSYLCNKLGKQGSQIIIPYRGNFYDVRDLRLCGDLGQVLFQPYHPRNDDEIRKAIKYSNVVINLIGREFATKNFTIADANVEIPARLARLSKEMGVEKFIHISALNADPNPPTYYISGGSQFYRTKYQGEKEVLREFPEATIFRPSDMYGSGDKFLRYYGHMWRHVFRKLAVYKKGEETIKQPVYVGDVAAAIVAACKDPDAAGKIYQAVGPKRYLLSELLDWFHVVMKKGEPDYGYYRYDLRYDPVMPLKLFINGLFPGYPMGHLTPERVERVSNRKSTSEIWRSVVRVQVKS
ncbi:NADH dehydrogenase [ubiquinone] 1 alpha subcomplex subunit 9, mitochondrial-like isoform X2 [Diaphorina citri]|uniref:NADH dehydrogenase [ubiquinone] 1 alpha subcomplex subunit 9, mitochondrial n=1 Tax=Diaphorina citri TaxID=121845 RepID=A0A3Q0JPX9_DIACI|nr:NADH dehydrogenase [ubiquinone] 1 alpha subcomplex subunit 9, mitochondrial-like isoform X1 [Diaphorina citri]XP_026688901.1 NADH dehydrogenase [ubiquinone] 1 alpha subcomplex subunit 9, mitochondrial-like isoform X2 [Diaphorina citri]